MGGSLWLIEDISPSPEDQKVLGSGVKSSGLDWRVLVCGGIIAEDMDRRTKSPRRPHSIWITETTKDIKETKILATFF